MKKNNSLLRRKDEITMGKNSHSHRWNIASHNENNKFILFSYLNLSFVRQKKKNEWNEEAKKKKKPSIYVCTTYMFDIIVEKKNRFEKNLNLLVKIENTFFFLLLKRKYLIWKILNTFMRQYIFYECQI